MILRFMGDLPEPKLSEVPPDAKSESLAKRLYGSISRKLGASKQLQEGLEAEVRLAGVELVQFGTSRKPRAFIQDQFLDPD